MTRGDAPQDGGYEPVGDVRARARDVKRNRPAEEPHEHGGHGPGAASVREDTYRGHHIVIRTTYEVTVDGRPVTGHIGVANDGRVHYHPIPNVSFGSAVDVIKQLIDAFPDEFAAPADPGHTDHDHPGHHH